MSEEPVVKATTTTPTPTITTTAAAAAALGLTGVRGQDTEEVEGPGHIDDGVSGLRLLPRRKLDDLLGGLEELGDAGPRAVAFRTLGRHKDDPREAGLFRVKNCIWGYC